jgi:putative glutamine amidotransferase
MKKIGIVGWNTGDNSFGITKAYAEWLAQFGTIHIVAPQKGIVEELDLLILPGGLDLAPQASDVLPSFYTSNTDVMKQYFFDVNLDQYIAAGIPIFGICLGFQQLCVKFGGTLIQNYPFNYSSKSRSEKVDELKFSENLFAMIDKTSIPKKYEVNSLHHQGCYDLSESMILATEKNDLNIELAKFSDNIYGVQYHPEEINDPISNFIITKLLNG